MRSLIERKFISSNCWQWKQWIDSKQTEKTQSFGTHKHILNKKIILLFPKIFPSLFPDDKSTAVFWVRYINMLEKTDKKWNNHSYNMK